jgi:hypothetical protein
MHRLQFLDRRDFDLTCRLAIAVLACCRCVGAIEEPAATREAQADPQLPKISRFAEQPSDRFLVDIAEVTGGHPYKGVNSARPHAGAHVHFDNTKNHWPREGTDPRHYPAIYAVADGIVSRVDTRFQNGANDRYGLDLSFARDDTGAEIRFCYSIEPMAPEPSEGFFKDYILVREGQRVRKGDVVAYLYTPPKVGACHMHFHLMVKGKQDFQAPAIFTPEIARELHNQCHGFRELNGGEPIPACLGYRLGAEENPFGTGPTERL